MHNKSFSRILLLMDWFTMLLAWVVFYFSRKWQIEKTDFSSDQQLYIGAILVPLFWVFLFYLQGTYYEVKRNYRTKIVSLSLIGTLLGAVILFFVLLLDDQIENYQSYYDLFLLLFSIHFLCLFIPRFLYISWIVRLVHKKGKGFKTLIIGGNEKAVQICNEIKALPRSSFEMIGFVNLNGVDRLLEDQLTYLGHFKDIERILQTHPVEEVIIALESNEHERIKPVLDQIEGRAIRINILPDMYDILAGSLKMTNLFGALLIQVDAYSMPIWQRSLKRFIDVLISIFALIVLIPFYLTMAILVKFSSPGPIFFLQERIGINGKKFKIIKFRTMYTDAEKLGPQLSSSNDPRITKIGKVMRKLRLDEFPQFFNVLVGDMSLVGPRPERDFYFQQIVKLEPQFRHLTKVRPGITSWGQVKFGYAENIEQMIQRMKFDLLYLKNQTLALDFKILLYTVLIIVKAKGK